MDARSLLLPDEFPRHIYAEDGYHVIVDSLEEWIKVAEEHGPPWELAEVWKASKLPIPAANTVLEDTQAVVDAAIAAVKEPVKRKRNAKNSP